GITEREVKAAVRAGARRWTDVHAHHGVEPCCGKCQCEIVKTIAEHEAQDATSGPIFGAPALVAAG
ncbi:MAG: (2Fe-2S)-binding protein, partial [Rhodospirillaceae bacterium]